MQQVAGYGIARCHWCLFFVETAWRRVVHRDRQVAEGQQRIVGDVAREFGGRERLRATVTSTSAGSAIIAIRATNSAARHVQLERIAFAQRRDRGGRRVEADRRQRHHEDAGREERAMVERAARGRRILEARLRGRQHRATAPRCDRAAVLPSGRQFRGPGACRVSRCAREPARRPAAAVDRPARPADRRAARHAAGAPPGRGQLRDEELGQHADVGRPRPGGRRDEGQAVFGRVPVSHWRAFGYRRRSASPRRSITVVVNLRAMRRISGLSSGRQRRAGRDHQNESVRRRIASAVPPAAHRRCVLIEPFWGVSS